MKTKNNFIASKIQTATVCIMFMAACCYNLPVSAASKGRQQTLTKTKSTTINIAPYTVITRNPYCGTLQYLTDGITPSALGGRTANKGPYLEHTEIDPKGEIATYACFPIKSSKQTITFKLPKLLKISAIRFFQRAAYSDSFAIEADTTGDGKFDTIALERHGTAKPDWNSEKLPDSIPKVYQIRFRSLKENGRGAPQIAEFELLVENSAANQALIGKCKAQNIRSLPNILEWQSAQPYLTGLKTAKKDKYQFGVVASLWMWLSLSDPYGKTGINQHALQVVKDMDFDRVRLFVKVMPKSIEKITMPTNPEYLSRIYPADIKKSRRYQGIGSLCMPWPSKVMFGYKENVLKRFAEDMAKEGIGVGIIPPRDQPPFDVRPGFYPMAQADCHEKPDPRFPCVWHGGYWVPAFSQIIKEITESSVASVDVTPDEFYIEGHNLQRMPKNDPCRKKFKASYGTEVPEKVADSEAYRKWITYNYQSTADTFNKFAIAAKKANPDVITEVNLSKAFFLFYDRPNFTLALDMIGHAGKIDYMGTDPYFRADTLGHYQMPKATMVYRGTTPTKKTVMMLQAVCGDFRTPLTNPVWAAGNATSVLMRGCHDIDFYRITYFASIYGKKAQPPIYNIYKQWIKMIRNLEPLGLKQAKIPKDIAFIYSRSSIDWWELKERMKLKQTGKKLPYNNAAMAGYAHHDAVMKMLFTNGLPFELYYLEQPSTLKNILDYKTIIIPFPYSISQAAIDILGQARRKGVKIVIVNQLGETNEFGTPTVTPQLKAFIKQPGVKYIGIDLLKYGNTPASEKKIITALTTMLGDKRSLSADTNGLDVEVGLLTNKTNGNSFIPVVNWHNKAVEVKLGVKVPAGEYQLSRYGLDGISSASKKFTAKELKNFAVKLKKHETFIFVIKPVKKSR